MRIWMMLFFLSFLSFNLRAETLTFGVVPQQSAKKMAALWSPVLRYLSQSSGLKIQFSTAKNIPEFEKRLLAGEYDIAYMNPYHYTVFSQKPGYRAIAKQKDKKIKGIVVIKKDSPLVSLNELNGSKLAFPSPAAFAASVLPRAYMEQNGIGFSPKYVSSHDSVYLNVSKGFFPAGGGVMRTFNNSAPEVREQLKVLWTTPAYTSHAIAVHPSLSTESAQKLVQSMLAMNNDPAGKALLKNLNFKGLEAASDQQWNDIRDLNIRLLDHMLQ